MVSKGLVNIKQMNNPKGQSKSNYQELLKSRLIQVLERRDVKKKLSIYISVGVHMDLKWFPHGLSKFSFAFMMLYQWDF